jgi:hypothetical protein
VRRAGRNASEHRVGLESTMQEPTRHNNGEGRCRPGSERWMHRSVLPGWLVAARTARVNTEQERSDRVHGGWQPSCNDEPARDSVGSVRSRMGP